MRSKNPKRVLSRLHKQYNIVTANIKSKVDTLEGISDEEIKKLLSSLVTYSVEEAPTFKIKFECTVTLGADQLWHDTDYPVGLTEQDVLDFIRHNGGPVGFMQTWNVWPGNGKVTVTIAQ